MHGRATLVRTTLLLAAATLTALTTAAAASAQAAPTSPTGAPAIGEPAPAFALPDTRGATHELQQYRGSWVVLEWLNYGCPYVRKHYRTGNIPGQQEKWMEEGVVWFSIVSSAPGTQGHYEPGAMNELSSQWGNNAPVLLDPDGVVGRRYEARTTPHMFVIDPEGTLVYMGGIDDVPTSRDGDLERATQLVDLALTQATAGEPVTRAVSQPYGCAVKYR